MAPPPEADAILDATSLEPTRTPTPEQRRDAWTAASDWCLAAAVYAKGPNGTRHQQYLDSATAAAAALGIELPALPTAPDAGASGPAVVEALTGDVGAKLAAALAERLDVAAGAAAQLAIQAHLLLLTYSPMGDDVPNAALAIREAGRASGLPADMWQPLADLLERRAEFVAVRTAVFDLREKAPAVLAESPSSGPAP